MLYALALVFSLIFSHSAQAEVFFSPALLYKSSKSEQGNNMVETTQTLYELRAGYILTQSVYVGLLYAMDDTQDADIQRTSYGPSVGYIGQNFYALAHYIISSELEQTSSTFSGAGIQLDIGYVFSIASNTSLGAQLSYKSFTYDEAEVGGVSGDLVNELEQTNIDPYIVLAFRF